jgi:hypothetical protein
MFQPINRKESPTVYLITILVLLYCVLNGNVIFEISTAYLALEYVNTLLKSKEAITVALLVAGNIIII